MSIGYAEPGGAVMGIYSRDTVFDSGRAEARALPGGRYLESAVGSGQAAWVRMYLGTESCTVPTYSSSRR
eukprot:SAG31_NODE_4297_length_3373_cov_3.080941_2_plen_70_part_00